MGVARILFRRRVVLLAGVAGLILSACGAESRSPEPEHPRLVVVGIDGATWDVIDPMIARGELPHFRALLERGARARLISLPPSSSPVVWTTIATGTFPRSHEILGFTYPYGAAAGRPVSSDLRRDPAIWNVASAYGKRVGVVGYFVSHPPEVVDGFMVSDRMIQNVPGATYPPELQAELGPVVRSIWDGTDHDRLLRRFLPWDYRPEAADDPSDPRWLATRIARGRIDEVVLRDESYRRIALELLDRPVDLFECYFRVVDHSCHAAWMFHDPESFPEPPEPADVELLGEVIPEAYRYMDDFLGEVVERVGADANLIVVSDHGFGPNPDGAGVPAKNQDVLSGSHRIDGILLAAGPDVRHGEVEVLTTIDVTPLLATLLGLPLSDELEGRLAEDFFRPDYFDDHPLRRVSRWELDWQPPVHTAGAVPTEAEAASLETLEALGYVGDMEVDDAPAGQEEVDFWSGPRGNREHMLTGETTYRILRGETRRARELVELVRERDPASAAILPERVRGLLAAMERELGKEPGALTDLEALRESGL